MFETLIFRHSPLLRIYLVRICVAQPCVPAHGGTVVLVVLISYGEGENYLSNADFFIYNPS